MGYVRVRPPEFGGVAAVRHPEHGEYVVPSPNLAYRDDDPLVMAYPWLFMSDEELDRVGKPETPREVRVENATQRPGQRRGNVRR
jgi:hypothetical protein